MSELISRQDAIKACMKYSGQGYIWSLIMKEIEKLPSATNKNVGTQLGTNLAEVGTEAISKRSAIDALRAMQTYKLFAGDDMLLIDQAGAQTELMLLPPIQPEIVRCKDCKYAEYIDDVQTLWCTECGQGRTVAPDDFCSYAGRREVTT